MSWISVGIGAVGLLNSMNSGSSTGGAGAQMYVPTGLGAADQGWQQNQSANQGQLNYGGYGGAPAFMGGMTNWGGGMSQGGYPTPQPQPQQQQQPGMATGSMGMPQNGYYTGSDASQQNTGQGGFNSTTGQYSPNTAGGPTAGGGGQQQQGLAQPTSSGLAGLVDPALYQSYALQQGINYNPYLQASQQAGQQYGGLANQAAGVGNQMYGQGAYAQGQQQQLGQQGNQFLGQQQRLAGQSQGIGYGQLAQSQGLAGGLQQAGQQVANTAFDPQQQLYNKLQQQTVDQSNAVNSMYGLGSSGAGAGVVDQNLNNFNIDWQNQQLARQGQGLQAMTGANQAASGILGQGYGGAQTGINSAGTLGSQGVAGLNQLNQTGAGLGSLSNASYQAGLNTYGQQPGFTQQSAGVPLSAQQQVAGMPAQNATQYASGIGQAMAPYNQQQNQAIPYMNYGSGAGQNAYANTLVGNQQQAQQMNSVGQALGNASSGINWSQVGNWFNPGTSGATAGGVSGGTTPDYSSWYGGG